MALLFLTRLTHVVVHFGPAPKNWGRHNGTHQEREYICEFCTAPRTSRRIRQGKLRPRNHLLHTRRGRGLLPPHACMDTLLHTQALHPDTLLHRKIMKKKKLYTLPADWGSFVLETTYSTPDVEEAYCHHMHAWIRSSTPTPKHSTRTPHSTERS